MRKKTATRKPGKEAPEGSTAEHRFQMGMKTGDNKTRCIAKNG